jgi:RNA polymerase sigma factor (sigma-70 family)
VAALAESELPHAGRGVAVAWRLASDDALVRAAARGHDGAFAALFSRYHAPLVRYCRSMLLDPEDAQDAAQNALTAALRSLRSERAALPLRLRPWLYRIAHNEAIAVARRRSPASATGLDEEAAALAAPDDSEAREAFRELLGDLRELPERQRSALVLRELEGLSYAEVAGALDLSGDAARQAVFEARAALSAHREGRATACVDVRRKLTEGDGRTARTRALRAHQASCTGCEAFAEEMRGRRRALRALFPLPGIVAFGSGSGAAIVGIGASSVATKCAALCATAVVLGGSVAAIETTSKLHSDGGVVSATAGPTPVKRQAPRAAAPVRTTQAVVVPKRATPAPERAKRPAPRRRARIHVAPAKTPAKVVVAHALPARMAPATTTTTTAAAPVAPPTQQAAAPTTTATTPQVDLAAQRRQQFAATLAAAQQKTAEVMAGVQQTVQQTMTSAQAGLLELQRRILAGLTGQRSGG